MLRIKKPVVYCTGSNLHTQPDNMAEMNIWGGLHGFIIRHPAQFNGQMPQEIYEGCRRASSSDVILLDLNKGKDPTAKTPIELGIGIDSGAILIGYATEGENKIPEVGSDQDEMIRKGLHQMFYGSREEVLEHVASYIKTNVVDHYRHEDPSLGRKLLPPETEEVFETLTPDFEVELTRFSHVVNSSEMRRLREVKQLGALFWIYPDATHTRYAHSVMTYHFARIMLNHLDLSRETRRHVLAYALLHDIGHTPYCHELENIANLDQMGQAIRNIQEPEMKEALKKDGIDIQMLLKFFRRETPWRLIVSDKLFGADKIAYLLRDGIATGKGGYDNVHLLLEHTVFRDSLFGIDEAGTESALKQIELYFGTYANTYYRWDSRLNQRIYTLIGQKGIDSGALPQNWHRLTDREFDFFIKLAEHNGNAELKKLSSEGIMTKAYDCIGSMRLPGCENFEKSHVKVEGITEEEYRMFLQIPVKRRMYLEEYLCQIAGLSPLDILVSQGGNLDKLRVDDALVFRRDQEKPIKLLADLFPHKKEQLGEDVKRQAISVRFYARKECKDAAAKLDEVMATFREVVRDGRFISSSI